jgi:hypothetical protein
LSIDCSTATGKVAFAMVKGSKTKTNPSGNVRAAFERLKNKYEPNTTPQLMQLTKDFHTKTLMKHQDPDLFITDLEALIVRMSDLGHYVSEQTMILHILNNLDESYEMEIKILEHRIQMMKQVNQDIWYRRYTYRIVITLSTLAKE